MRRLSYFSMSLSVGFVCGFGVGCDDESGDDSGMSDGGACSDLAEPSLCAADALPKNYDVLDAQLAAGENCESGDRCAVIIDTPDEKRTFLFSLREYDSVTGDSIDSVLVASRKECVEAWLDALELEYFSADHHPRFVVETSYADIAPLLEWSAMSSYEVECAEDACQHCVNLGEDACSADPFCSVEMGAPYDEGEACWSTSRFAACLVGSAFCDDAQGVARGPDGKCWAFPSLCYAEGFDYGDDECTELSSGDESKPNCE